MPHQRLWIFDVYSRLSTLGDRAFPVAAARLWNSLPSHVTAAPSLSTFCCRLKSHLFSLSYPAFWLLSHLYIECPPSDSSFWTLQSLLHLTLFNILLTVRVFCWHSRVRREVVWRCRKVELPDEPSRRFSAGQCLVEVDRWQRLHLADSLHHDLRTLHTVNIVVCSGREGRKGWDSWTLPAKFSTPNIFYIFSSLQGVD